VSAEDALLARILPTCSSTHLSGAYRNDPPSWWPSFACCDTTWRDADDISECMFCGNKTDPVTPAAVPYRPWFGYAA